MKSITQSLITLIVLSSLSLSAFAASEKPAVLDHQLPTYKVEDLTLPVAKKVVTPRLRAGQVGEEIKMIFTVTAEGRAIGIRSSKPFSDSADVAGAMTQVLRSWEFEPSRDKNGIARAVKVSLPIKIVSKSEKNEKVVRLAMAKPTLLAVAK